MKKGIFDEEFVTNFIEGVKALETKLDEIFNELKKIVNDSDYLGGDSCSSNFNSLFNLNWDLEEFLQNALDSFNAFLEDLGIGVDEGESLGLLPSEMLPDEGLISEESIDFSLLLDIYLSRCSTLAQNDSKWDELGYSYNGSGDVGNNGCGPSSLTNQLITAFGITDQEIVADLFKEVIALTEKSGLNWLNEYFMSPDAEKYRKYTALNSLMDNYDGQIIPVTGVESTRKFIEEYKFEDGKPVMIIGKFTFYQNTGDSSWDNSPVINLVNSLYERGVNADLYFGSLAVGTEDLTRPFRGGRAGHYVAVSINTYEFCEDGTIYLIDSYPKNLFEESSFKLNYAFVDYPRKFAEFNATYNVERVSDTVLKIQLKNGQSFNVNNMSLLGLSSGGTLMLSYGKRAVASSSFNTTSLEDSIASLIPDYTSTSIASTDTIVDPFLHEVNVHFDDEKKMDDSFESVNNDLQAEMGVSNDPEVNGDTIDYSKPTYQTNNGTENFETTILDSELDYVFEYILKNNVNQSIGADSLINLGQSTFFWKDIVKVYLDKIHMLDYVQEICIDNGSVNIKLANGQVIELGTNVTFDNLTQGLLNLKASYKA